MPYLLALHAPLNIGSNQMLKRVKIISIESHLSKKTPKLETSSAAVTIDSKRVVAAIDAASAVPIGSMDKWIDTLFKNYENELKAHKEVTISMQVGTQDVDIKSLNNIRELIHRLKIEIQSLLQNVDFAIEEEDMKVAIEEIKKRLGVIMNNVEDL
ncbi:unnamed protein product [Lupinus luteus]|uniref:Uncharacterized protein n=1 Tax=Lupinus luteus TaxID=3873 RepID=A0AAV1X1L1_LUPLU